MRHLAFLPAAFTLFAATPAFAAPVLVSLGASSETFTLYGLGPSALNAALGTFAIGTGAGVYDAATDMSIFTLSGTITGGTAGYNSGTYSFITRYAGMATPLAGPNGPIGRSNAINPDRFNYAFLDPGTTITLFLFLPGGTFAQPLFAGGNFVAGTNFSFTSIAPQCTGVAVCTQNNVGRTRGATIFGPVRTTVSFDVPVAAAVPEPASWAMMIAGFGAIGAAMRRRRRGLAIA